MKRTKKEMASLVVGSWVALGVVLSALTFAYKVYEFSATVPRGEVLGFAVMQVVTYLFVAMGFFLLFIWSFVKGDFKDFESAKWRILDMEERANELDRRSS